MRYYIDACVWIDYFDERDFEIADVVSRIILDDELIVSKFLLKELSQCSNLSLILKLEKVVLVDSTPNQNEEAASLSDTRNVPFGDALHAVLARDYGAVIVTSDNHFRKLVDIVDIQLL